MHGTAHPFAADYARFRERAPEPCLDDLTATLDVCDVSVPFGLIDVRVTIAGEGDGWYVREIDLFTGTHYGRELWASIAGPSDPAHAPSEAIERAIFEAVMADIKADPKFDERAIEALVNQLG